MFCSKMLYKGRLWSRGVKWINASYLRGWVRGCLRGWVTDRVGG
jgi:hypothetical protein